jgi:hypothetical protein
MFHAVLALTSLFGALFAATPATGQVPSMISYQGRVLMNNTNFGGTGQFKFALVNANGSIRYWLNSVDLNLDGQPDSAVSISVANGLVTTYLGDTATPNMQAIPATVFNNSDVRLRVWFNGGAGFQQLSPDQRIVSVGYAMMANSVPDGSITSAKLAAGTITSAQISDGSIAAADLAPNSVNTGHIIDGQVMNADLANNAVTSAKVADGSLIGSDLANGTIGTLQLANTVALGATNVAGRLDVYRTSANTPGISLFGSSSQLSTYGADGLEQIRLWGSGYGELLLNNSLANNATAVRLTAQGSTGGQLELRNTNGVSRAVFEGENTGGRVTLYQGDGNTGAILYGNETGTGGGAISLRKADGNTGMRAYGGVTSGSLQLINRLGNVAMNLWAYDDEEGTVSIRNSAGAETVYIWGRDSTGAGHGQIGLKKSDGTETVTIQASESGAGGQIILYNTDRSVATVQIDGQVGTTGGGYIDLRKPDGSLSIVLTADDGTIQSQVVEITGGSDFSEKFDIQGEQVEPGMIVSIDPRNPGQLVASTETHDKKAAGIISGAGGVKPGMLMGQRGSVADGKHPVALTGRVYCWADADANGAIEPGDMITTSATAGHGMKVTDHQTATGAIVGKAMTSLKEGKGLVLVLVNLQ